MNIHAINNLSHDLAYLYYRTKDSRIENLFVKVASINAENFSKWIWDNKRVKKNLFNPEIFETFELLSYLRQQYTYGEPIDKSQIIQYFMSDQHRISKLPIISVLESFSRDPSVKEIIIPFIDLITFINSVFNADSSKVEGNIILKDLITLKNSYYTSLNAVVEEARPKKGTVVEQRRKMLKHLFVTFSDQLANAAENANRNDLATAFRGGILSKPFPIGLGPLIDSKKEVNVDFYAVKKVLDFIWKNYDYKFSDYNHDFVDVAFLRQAEQISQEELAAIISGYEKEKNLLSYLEEDEERYKGLPISINPDKRLNPSYLALLVAFFIMYQMKLGIPVARF